MIATMPRTIACTCGTRHRSWRTTAECALRKVVRYTAVPLRRGDGGPYALLGCKNRQGRTGVRATTVSLWSTYESAAARRGMDSCGGLCRGDHEIVLLARGDDR
jgi:hypothetical protein